MDKDDIDHPLHGIRILVQVAIDAVLTMDKSKAEPGFFRLPEPDSEILHFTLFDVRKRVDELKAEQSATAAPDPESGGQRSDAADRPDIDWLRAYFGIESFLYEAVQMAQIVDDMADDVDRDDPASWSRFAFAVNHSRSLLDEVQRRYDKRDWRRPHEQQG